MSLREFLEKTVNGCTFCTLTTETEVKLPKKHPLHGRVMKRVTGSNVMLFSNKRSNAYSLMVKRRLEQEGIDPDNFTLSPRKWGTRLPNVPMVVHDNGSEYLEVIFKKSGEVEYYVGGVLTPADQINLPTRSEAVQGGLSDDNKVILRTYALESIKSITIEGDTYNM